MSAHELVAQRYYDGYQYSGWDLSLMNDVLKGMDLAVDAVETARQKPEVSFLMLGSATERNMDNMALMDRLLRPGQGDQDTVTVIDYNALPLKQHARRKAFLKQWDENYKSRSLPDDAPTLLYPDFNFAQADMRHLPLSDESVDVVVSDYTLNFASDIGEADAVFAEASRVMADGGMLLMAVNGNPDYAGIDEVDEPIDDMHHDVRTGGFVINELPLPTYRNLAAANGLRLEASSLSGTDMLCGIFQKYPSPVPMEHV